MAKTSPTQRTLRALRHEGATCAVVEKWNPYAGPRKPDGSAVGIRQDLFGFIDILVLDPERGFVGVQCCARSGHAAHRHKILEDCTELAMEWLKCGGKIEIWSWAKQKLKRGGKAMRWVPKVEAITLESFQSDDAEIEKTLF